MGTPLSWSHIAHYRLQDSSIHKPSLFIISSSSSIPCKLNSPVKRVFLHFSAMLFKHLGSSLVSAARQKSLHNRRCAIKTNYLFIFQKLAAHTLRQKGMRRRWPNNNNPLYRKKKTSLASSPPPDSFHSAPTV